VEDIENHLGEITLRWLGHLERMDETNLKGELGELKFYLRKIPLHQQKFLVVSVLSNLAWLLRNLKTGPK